MVFSLDMTFWCMFEIFACDRASRASYNLLLMNRALFLDYVLPVVGVVGSGTRCSTYVFDINSRASLNPASTVFLPKARNLSSSSYATPRLSNSFL
jgi:hypothetical protein